MSNEELLSIALEGAKKAGVVAMGFSVSGDLLTKTKVDDTPVTNADIAANKVLIDHLNTLTPHIPVISEESKIYALSERKKWSQYWLLDPIDGTGEFILGSDDFAVNIALIDHGVPLIGVVHAPKQNTTYYALKEAGAFKVEANKTEKIQVSQHIENASITMAVSRRQSSQQIAQHLNNEYQYDFLAMGSCSLKICLVAEGKADCYMRLGPTSEWDTAAGECILVAAGGSIKDIHGQPITYNQRESLINPDFISLSTDDFPWNNIFNKSIVV